jgi:signal transduction histidine kinase
VTQLKQTEAERERLAAELQESLKLESLGLTIAGMAHDLNTPIGIAITASTHLNRTVRQMRAVEPEAAVPAEQVSRWAGSLDKAIELVAGNLQKAAELVRSFKQTTIDASRVEWRKLTLLPFFESLVTSVSPLMKRSQCSIHVECPPSLELITEPGSLSQVVMNLLVNATLHAFDGRSDRQIRIVVQDSEDQILIEVSDNGNGMSEEALSKAFMPFFTTKRGAGGSGLGLFSSRRVVEQTLGGRIQVHAAAGQGTSFRIQLPKNRPAAT